MFIIKKKRCFSVLALCAAAVFSFTGCKESPQSSIVVNKDLDKLIEKAGEHSENEAVTNKKYDEYKTAVRDDSLNVTVNVDAKVDVPPAEKMSVLRISQKKISQELLDAARRELLGDTPLYDGAALKMPTKKSIEEYISGLRGEMELFDKSSDKYKENQAQIDRLKEEYNKAPDQISVKEYQSDGRLRPVSEKYNEDTADEFYSWLYSLCPEGEIFYGVSDAGDGNYCQLYAMNDENMSDYLSFRRGKQGYEHVALFGFSDIAGGNIVGGDGAAPDLGEGEPPKLSLDAAVGIADGFLEKTGINNASENFRFYDGAVTTEQPELELMVEDETVPCTYYLLTYMRYVDNAFITGEAEEKFNANANGSSKKFWPTEKIEFRIDDSGIVGFDYTAPVSITETVVEDSAMQPFESIRDTFEKMVVVKNAQGDIPIQIDIDRVVLGYAMISEPDNFDSALLVPVWDFIGTMDTAMGKETREDYSYLTVNAIDGSIIDRMLGY